MAEVAGAGNHACKTGVNAAVFGAAMEMALFLIISPLPDWKTRTLEMRVVTKLAFFAALLIGAGFSEPPPAAAVTTLDGIWSVLIITEKGECDRGYRYEVKVANGHVSYAGDASLDMNGTITPGGLVKVSIRLGSKGAEGIGHLAGQSGVGTWHGAGGNSTCAGRWEAERR
jgi:hypothetical protein